MALTIEQIKQQARDMNTQPHKTITKLFVSNEHYGIFGEMIVFEKCITRSTYFVGIIVRYFWHREIEMWLVAEVTYVTKQMYDLATEVINERGY